MTRDRQKADYQQNTGGLYELFGHIPISADRRATAIDHVSASDFNSDDKNFGVVPNVGDFVQLTTMGNKDAPTYSGRVKSRLFRYFEKQMCSINIVVEQADDQDLGLLINE